MSPRYLVVGLEFGTLFLAFHILGMSSSQLTDLYFSERLKPQAIIINQLIISMVATWIILPVGHWLATKVFRGVGIPPTRYPIDCLLRISLLYPILTVGGAGSQPNPGIQLNPPDAAGNLNVAYRLNVVFLGYLSGWWFQSFFHNVWDNPSHWRTHIFQDGFLTINQLMMFFCFVSRILNKFKSMFNGHFADMMTLSISPVLFDHELSPVWMM